MNSAPLHSPSLSARDTPSSACRWVRSHAKCALAGLFALTLACCADSSGEPAAPTLPAGFRSEFADVNGIRLHYVIGGRGDAIVLLHGWPQTWFEWHRVMPELAELYTVIAPDLRGAGETDAPPTTTGYEKQTMAEDVLGLLSSLGIDSAHVVGHDIGAMVAYPFAAKYPSKVKSLVLAEAPIPGIEPGWSQASSLRFLWHFGFHNERGLPELLVAGREREYLVSFYEKFALDKTSFTDQEIDEFVNAYSRPGRMIAGFEWYRAFDADAEYNRTLQANKLAMPLLMVGGAGFGTTATQLQSQGEVIGAEVKAAAIPGSGHWLLEEQPDLFVDELRAFLLDG